jgi:hypothetical protein
MSSPGENLNLVLGNGGATGVIPSLEALFWRLCIGCQFLGVVTSRLGCGGSFCLGEDSFSCFMPMLVLLAITLTAWVASIWWMLCH